MIKKYLFLVVFLTAALMATQAQKIDTIVHINGNVLTGDLKKMTYGVVTWKMDGMGTISLESPKINTIKSSKQFEVKLKNGMTYFGTIDSSGVFRHVNINIANSRELVHIDEIVEVYPIKRNFWLRTSGEFGLGINYSKGSDIATISFSGNINYRKKSSYFFVNWDDYNTYQADTLSSTKADANIGWERLLRKKWSLGTSFGIDQNSELGTKLRLNITTEGLYDIAYNSWNRFFAAAGLSAQRETPYDTSGVTTDLAGVVGIYWKVFKYTNPKIWVDASVTWIPYLTTAGRHRLNMNLNPKIGLIANDLKLGFTSYYSFDSKPHSAGGVNDDWGISLEISYSFH
jgi:small nuclear ribonucleoprotein (snRNP)-like protein